MKIITVNYFCQSVSKARSKISRYSVFQNIGILKELTSTRAFSQSLETEANRRHCLVVIFHHAKVSYFIVGKFFFILYLCLRL